MNEKQCFCQDSHQGKKQKKLKWCVFYGHDKNDRCESSDRE